MLHNAIFVSGTRTFETCFYWKRAERANKFSEGYLCIFCWRSNELHFSFHEDYNSSCSRTGDTLKDEENWFLVSSSSWSTRARDWSTETCCLSDSMVSSSSCKQKEKNDKTEMNFWREGWQKSCRKTDRLPLWEKPALDLSFFLRTEVAIWKPVVQEKN